MAKNKIGLQFEGWQEVIANLDKLQGDVEKATEQALFESQKIVAQNVHAAMKSHHKTGSTEESTEETGKVEWEGKTAAIEVGFNLAHGGMPSIFLMYGTPRMPKDIAVYNAVYGSKTKKEVSEKQFEIFLRAVAERMG